MSYLKDMDDLAFTLHSNAVKKGFYEPYLHMDEADRIVSDRFGDPTSSGDSASPQVTVDDDAGDALSYFQRLANES